MLNNNTKRVVFIGGKNVGCGCLEYLINSALNTEIVAIFVNYNSDILENRWYKSATEIAFKNNIPVYAPKRINSKRSIEIVRNYNPDFIVVIYYDQILNDEIIKIPKHGCINLHMALAEEYRGCFPTTWAIINNELKTGITIHYIDTGVDTGDIISQVTFPITNDMTGKSLYDKCTNESILLFKDTWPDIVKGTNNRRKQITTDHTKYYKRVFPSHEINFNLNGIDIYNKIRALIFDPFPKPYFYIGKKKYIIMAESEKDN